MNMIILLYLMVKVVLLLSLPRYFDKLVEKYELSDIDLEKIKKYRQEHSEEAQMSFDKQSSLSYIEYLESLENKKVHQVSSLKRSL